MKNEFDYVAVGSVKHGDWMRRYQAEAEEIEYREITEQEAEEITRQIEAYQHSRTQKFCNERERLW